MQVTNRNIIFRDNLIHIFDRLSDERIIYVCAPAGYGKTVSTRQWLDSNTRTKTTLTLDEYDNDLTHFCERFCEALCFCQQQNSALSEIATHPAFASAPDEFTIRAIAALSKQERTILVIDDLHFITDVRVLHLLLTLLKRLPETFQIVLISRHNLPLGFSELWVKGHLSRITAEQLLFSNEEIMLLYKERGDFLTQEQADNICRFTGGWPIGVNALLLSGGEPSGESLDYLEDFIQHNVWKLWDEDTREFMVKTAIARELTPQLCIALTDNPNSEKVLYQLIQQNAFIFRARNGVYRYHRLFHDFLKHMLKERGEAFTHALLEKAGKWYLAVRDINNAMECFIQCENYEAIAQSIRILTDLDVDYTPSETLLPLTRSPIVCRAAEKYPHLYSILSWGAFNEGRATDMAEYADRYYNSLPAIANIDTVFALNIIFVKLIDFRNPLYEIARFSRKISMNFAEKKLRDSPGTINQNMPLLHRGTRDFSECATGDIEKDVTTMVAALGGLFGDEAHFLGKCLMAGLLYERGQLEKAYCHALAANAELKSHSSSESKFFAMSILVYVLDALGESEKLKQRLAHIGEMIEDNNAYYLNYNFDALIARRKLGNGSLETAREWLEQHEIDLHETVRFSSIYVTITTCRAYITIGDYDSAIILLVKVLELAITYKRPLDNMEARILLSIAYWKKKRGFQNEAMRHLESAVSLAHDYGYTQIFTNESPELSGMLHRLQKSIEQRPNENVVPSSFVKMLYLKIAEHKNSGLTNGQAQQPIKFTNKQKAVMKLLCEGKSYREITEILGIKRPTLRSHIALIYKKLDVTSETDAIMKINALGLLNEM